MEGCPVSRGERDIPERKEDVTVEFCQRFKVVLERFSHQLVCKYPPHGDGELDLCIGPQETGNTHCVKHTEEEFMQMAKVSPQRANIRPANLKQSGINLPARERTQLQSPAILFGPVIDRGKWRVGKGGGVAAEDVLELFLPPAPKNIRQAV